jgi:hypothetical protein
MNEDEIGGACSTHEFRNEYDILIGETEWKRPLGRPWYRWEDNIRMDLTDLSWEVVD